MDAGRNARALPWLAPITFAAASAYSGGPPSSPSRGTGAGKGECLMIRRLSTDSISSSVPKPNRFGCASAAASIQRRWSRENGRSSLLEVTMYGRSSGPKASSA